MNERGHDAALLVLRIALGVVFIAHGGQKLFGLFGGTGLHGFTPMIEKMGMPPIVATLVAIGELFGGLGLLAGLLTRLAAIGPLLSMAGAIVLVHGKNGFFLPTGFEYALTLLLVDVAVLFAGPGRYSLDALLHRSRHEVPVARPLHA
ncbi:MAG TPA: DoxX family protein [Thermoanaerobaculia bacterium]|nr:DoxX family protein [Thermoanaerobaculia bacterium]